MDEDSPVAANKATPDELAYDPLNDWAGFSLPLDYDSNREALPEAEFNSEAMAQLEKELGRYEKAVGAWKPTPPWWKKRRL